MEKEHIDIVGADLPQTRLQACFRGGCVVARGVVEKPAGRAGSGSGRSRHHLLAQRGDRAEQFSNRGLHPREPPCNQCRLDPELRRDHDAVPPATNHAAELLLGDSQAVHRGDVEMADPELVCRLEQAKALVPARLAKETRAAEPQRARIHSGCKGHCSRHRVRRPSRFTEEALGHLFLAHLPRPDAAAGGPNDEDRPAAQPRQCPGSRQTPRRKPAGEIGGLEAASCPTEEARMVAGEPADAVGSARRRVRELFSVSQLRRELAKSGGGSSDAGRYTRAISCRAHESVAGSARSRGHRRESRLSG